MRQQWSSQYAAWAALVAAAAVLGVGLPGPLALTAGVLAAAAAGALRRPAPPVPEPVAPVAAAARPTAAPAPRRAAKAGVSEAAVREVAELSSASDDVAERFSSVASALDVLRAAAGDVTAGSAAARRGAGDAVERASAAGAQVASLLEASRQIGEVTGVIASITDQTRTLALNATIEAARAGAAGRGFAVVAGEVKELAGATARAAQSIAVQVTAVQDVTRSAAEAIEAVGAVLAELDRTQAEVAEAVARQGAAGDAISSDVALAARGSSRMAELVAARVDADQRTFVVHALELAQDLLADAGGIAPSGSTTTWQTRDPEGRAATHVLPELLLGSTPVARVDDPRRPAPLVDEVVRLVGGNSTLFQRLDERGDMLRVATTVVGTDGQRAVGTVLPSVAPDGTPHPVLQTVLAGKTYVGEATVLGRPHFAAYAPLRGADGDVLGVLYVGLPKQGR